MEHERFKRIAEAVNLLQHALLAADLDPALAIVVTPKAGTAILAQRSSLMSVGPEDHRVAGFCGRVCGVPFIAKRELMT